MKHKTLAKVSKIYQNVNSKKCDRLKKNIALRVKEVKVEEKL